MRAAGLLLIKTVGLPGPITVPLLVGGIWNVPAGGIGRCGDVFVAVLPTMAAG